MSEELNNKQTEHEDAFERDAAEGFAMLGSEKEIEAIKAETDKAFSSQFKTASTGTRTWFITAAAAVVVFSLGVSIFTYLQPRQEAEVSQTLQQISFPTPNEPGMFSNDAAEQAPADSNAAKKPSATKLRVSDSEPIVSKLTQQSKSEEAVAINQNLNTAPAAYSPTKNDAAPQLAAQETEKTEPSLERKEAEADQFAIAESKKEQIASDADYKAPSDKIAEKKAKALTSTPKPMQVQTGAIAGSETLALTDSIALVYYVNGVDVLKDDTKALLKNSGIRYPIDVSLTLNQAGTVIDAKIFPKAVLDKEIIERGATALKKLKPFKIIGGKASQAEHVYRYNVR